MPRNPAFTNDIIAAAQRGQKFWGVFASVTLAQFALESAYGKRMPEGSNNPFGIKAVAGQPSVATPTHEVINGRRVAITAQFRKFPSLADAFEEHAKLLATNHHYVKAMAAKTPEAFAAALTGVYATDPHYGQSLVTIIRQNDLTALDGGDPGDRPAPAKPKTMATSKIGNGTIVAGAGGVIASSKAVVDAAKDAKDTATDAVGLLASIGPWVALLVVIAGVAFYVWWQRRANLKATGL